MFYESVFELCICGFVDCAYMCIVDCAFADRGWWICGFVDLWIVDLWIVDMCIVDCAFADRGFGHSWSILLEKSGSQTST